MRVPMLPPAPGLLSMTTGCPSAWASGSAMVRASRSGDEPGGKGTTMWMARSGQSAWAAAGSSVAAARARNRRRSSAPARDGRAVGMTGAPWVVSLMTRVVLVVVGCCSGVEPRLARQQRGHGGHGRHAVEQHGAYRFGNGQFNAQRAGALQGGARAAHAFGGDAAGQDVGQLVAGADLQAVAAVARQFAGV